MPFPLSVYVIPVTLRIIVSQGIYAPIYFIPILIGFLAGRLTCHLCSKPDVRYTGLADTVATYSLASKTKWGRNDTIYLLWKRYRPSIKLFHASSQSQLTAFSGCVARKIWSISSVVPFVFLRFTTSESWLWYVLIFWFFDFFFFKLLLNEDVLFWGKGRQAGGVLVKMHPLPAACICSLAAFRKVTMGKGGEVVGLCAGASYAYLNESYISN